MGTTGSQLDRLELLRRLVRLDLEAVAAFRDAARHVRERRVRERLEAFRVEHEAHVQALEGLLRQAGGDPPRRSGARRVLNKGRVLLADLVGDEAVLRQLQDVALTANEEYEDALRHHDLGDAEPLLRRFREEERRHLAWIEQRLQEG